MGVGKLVPRTPLVLASCRGRVCGPGAEVKVRPSDDLLSSPSLLLLRPGDGFISSQFTFWRIWGWVVVWGQKSERLDWIIIDCLRWREGRGRVGGLPSAVLSLGLAKFRAAPGLSLPISNGAVG